MSSPIAPAKDSGRVSDRVADQVMAMIASGSLSLGQRLPGERQLAEQMGVSRVSVRAALQRLKTQGFLSAVQGGGTRVIATDAVMDSALTELARLNHENLHDLAELRMILEVWAARRAAERATADHLAEMATVLAAMQDDASRGQHKVENDMRFHLAVAKASGSAIYIHIVGVIRDILRQSLDYHRYRLFAVAIEDAQILAHHRAIYQGICDRDGEAAGNAMREHLTWVLARYDSARNEQVRQAPD